MIYNIINPSDALTMHAPSLLIAGVAVALLGAGNYGVKGTPILCGWDQWFADQGINDLGAFIESHKQEITDALSSVLLGSADERPALDAQMLAMSEPERLAFILERNDKMRSSMSNIEKQAHALAKAILK